MRLGQMYPLPPSPSLPKYASVTSLIRHIEQVVSEILAGVCGFFGLQEVKLVFES